MTKYNRYYKLQKYYMGVPEDPAIFKAGDLITSYNYASLDDCEKDIVWKLNQNTYICEPEGDTYTRYEEYQAYHSNGTPHTPELFKKGNKIADGCTKDECNGEPRVIKTLVESGISYNGLIVDKYNVKQSDDCGHTYKDMGEKLYYTGMSYVGDDGNFDINKKTALFIAEGIDNIGYNPMFIGHGMDFNGDDCPHVYVLVISEGSTAKGIYCIDLDYAYRADFGFRFKTPLNQGQINKLGLDKAFGIYKHRNNIGRTSDDEQWIINSFCPIFNENSYQTYSMDYFIIDNKQLIYRHASMNFSQSGEINISDKVLHTFDKDIDMDTVRKTAQISEYNSYSDEEIISVNIEGNIYIYNPYKDKLTVQECDTWYYADSSDGFVPFSSHDKYRGCPLIIKGKNDAKLFQFNDNGDGTSLNIINYEYADICDSSWGNLNGLGNNGCIDVDYANVNYFLNFGYYSNTTPYEHSDPFIYRQSDGTEINLIPTDVKNFVDPDRINIPYDMGLYRLIAVKNGIAMYYYKNQIIMMQIERAYLYDDYELSLSSDATQLYCWGFELYRFRYYEVTYNGEGPNVTSFFKLEGKVEDKDGECSPSWYS